MLQWWEALLLGSVQGISEFLPISSTGHLVLFERMFGIQSIGLSFDIFVHVGTLLSVLLFFRKDVITLFRTYWVQIFWATLPTVIFALLFRTWIESTRSDMTLMALSYAINAVLLGAASVVLSQSERRASQPVGVVKLLERVRAYFGQESQEKISSLQAALVGSMQALAIIPGVSRSASTVAGGLLTGLSREAAFRFAFLISIPAVAGAVVLLILDLTQQSSDLSIQWIPYLIAVAASAITGYAALRLLHWIMRQSNLWIFAGYCLLVSILIFSFA